jgi:dihydroorotate dehydrogenase (NAD+) catalytic subunit
VKDGGLSFGTNVDMVADLTKALRPLTNRLLVIKLTPNVTSVAPFATACEDAGADAISLINTVVGMSVDVFTHKPRLATVTGGLSGPAIRPIAVAQCYHARKATKLPIIGIGGITSAMDAMEFLIVGASLVQLGTINFVDPNAGSKVVDDLQELMKQKGVHSVHQLTNTLVVEERMKALGW